MADHNVSVELFYDGDWQPAPAYVRDGIALTRGAPGEGQEAPPSSATLTLDNRTKAYNPRNVTGPLYGAVGRNTPMRVSADGSVRSTTEVASWKPAQAVKGDAWTNIEGGGILRRLQQGSTPLRSSLERAIVAANPHAFWPLTDGKGATSLLSGVPGGEPLIIDGVRPGEIDGPIGSGTAFPDVAQAGSAVGPIPAGLPSSGWGMECLVYIGRPAVPGETPDLAVLQWSVAGSDFWRVFIGEDSSSPYVIVAGDIGTTDASVFQTTGIDRGWHHVRLLMEQSGGNVEVTLYVDGVNTGGSDSNTVAGTLGAPTGNLVLGDADGPATAEYMESASVGMVAFYPLADAVDHSAAAFGYPGERAGVRFLRVLGEEGITAVVVGDETDTQPMGPQPADTLVNITRECVRTDDGMLFEPRDDRALVMRTGRSRYNQDAALTLDFTGRQLAPGLQPNIDDKPTRNDVTAARRNGGSVRVQKTSGPMNVNDPIDDPEGVGRVDTRVDVNPEGDDRLLAHASWHLHKGTVDEARYPNIAVDLDAAPELAATLDALEIGDRGDLANLPTDWQYGNAALLLLGVRENYPAGAGDYRRLVTLNTAPASAYEIGVVGANDGSTDLRGQAVDTDNSTLQTGVNATATTLSVASAGGVLWTTDADDWNPALNGTCEWGGGLFIMVGGEVMRVTNITGGSSPQTFTVVRSANGAVKTHDSGAAVHVAYPIRVGL